MQQQIQEFVSTLNDELRSRGRVEPGPMNSLIPVVSIPPRAVVATRAEGGGRRKR
jgi:hypothetical protein